MATAQKNKQQRFDTENLRRRLKLKHLEAKNKLKEFHPHVHEFFEKKELDPGKIREHSIKLLGAGAIAGAMLLSPPSDIKLLPTPQEIVEKTNNQNKDDTGGIAKKDVVVQVFNSLLPAKPRSLIRNEEKFLEQVFQSIMGIKSKATLEGEHLNTTYGYIGIEQHLRRFPGDTLTEHGTGSTLKEGMAPGKGSWGYFAPSKEYLTNSLIETEKWYAVVQTLYLPDWNRRQPYLKEWYKYRKVLIVNTANGKAVVAAVADSGPAAWTGKQFGGSPEVMDYLGGSRFKKGKVLVFFVDDPESKMPLGPVEYDNL